MERKPFMSKGDLSRTKESFPNKRTFEQTDRMTNKAGYTSTSWGRVGRGGNARFPTFQLERDGPTNQPTDQPTDGRTDKASYRDACPQLKTWLFEIA